MRGDQALVLLSTAVTMTHHNRTLTAPKPPVARQADKPIPASASRKEMRAKSGFQTESYAYDFRGRNNLKQNKDVA